jgi:two-component system, LuxR family, sensor kinase FixL
MAELDDNDPCREPNQALTILQGAIENTNEGFVTIDENHRVVVFNREAERIFGIGREEILGKDLGVILTPQCSQGHKQAVARYLETRRPKLIGHQSEFMTSRRNGELFPLSISFSVSNIGEKTFFTGIIRDLTETKALQEQVLKSERLAALGQLVAEVSHEIKNPLVMIGGYARQLRRSSQDPKTQAKLQIITDEVQRLETLIEELRDLYRPKALDLETVDMAALLREIGELIREDGRNRGIETRLEIPPAPVLVEGDRNKLKQVILNLARNGMEAMDRGGTLTLRVRCLEDRVEITVSDEGPGIPTPELDKIFVPFYTTKKQGTGLGLSVSKRIIQEHQGCSFNLASGREKGAVATITMPLRACEIPTAGDPAVPDTIEMRREK